MVQKQFQYGIDNPWTDVVTFIVSKVDIVLTDKSLAIAELLAEREPDGSLPVISFFIFIKVSELINAEVLLGLPFLEKTPDLEAFEKERCSSQGILFSNCIHHFSESSG